MLYALNLLLSPEKVKFWDCTYPVQRDAGDTRSALQTSADRHPGASDSIGLDNGDEVTRQVSERPKGSW
jgi:hypothetical protein